MKNILLIICLFLILNYIHAQQPEFDKYGGYRKMNQPSGGYFTLGTFNDRHFLFTPEGNAYFALGINHFHTTKNTDFDGIIRDLKSWGFNSGCYQGPKWMWERFPYTQGINLLENRSYVSKELFEFKDVFSEMFLKDLEEHIKKIVEPQSENKMLIAYFLTDMPVWTKEKFGVSWVGFYKQLEKNSPGAKKWEEWKTTHPANNENEFLGVIAKQLYSKGVEIIKKYDKNHLVFSERYNESDISIDVIKQTLPFVDGIATQPSSKLNINYFEELFRISQKPIYIADHVSSFRTEEYPETMGQVAYNEKDYFEFYQSYVQTVLSLPYIVGLNKCQYENEQRPTLLKQGLVKVNGEPYDYVEKLGEFHRKVLKKAYGISN